MDYSTQQKRSIVNRVYVSRFFASISIMILVIYAGLTVQTAVFANERKELREEIRQTQIAISDLEVTYFELAQGIDNETIKSLGFTEIATPLFAYTGTVYPSVALR